MTNKKVFFSLLLLLLANSKLAIGSAKLPFCANGLSSLTAERANCKKNWSVFIFMAGDNDLSPYINFNLEQMAQGKQSDTENTFDIALEVDTLGNFGSKRIIIEDNLYTVDTLPEQDTGNPRTLENFLTWGISQYPADHYALIIWGHGNGWGYNSLAYDESSKSWLTIPYLRLILNRLHNSILDGQRIDFYASDACFMQMAEVSFELRNVADYIFGSVPSIDNQGLPYDLLFKNFSEQRYNGPTGPLQLAKELPQLYQSRYGTEKNSIASSIDSSQLATFSYELNKLGATAIPWIKTDTFFRLRLIELIGETNYYQINIRDLENFLTVWKGISSGYAELYQQISNVEKSITQMVAGSSNPNHDISLWLPPTIEEFQTFAPQYRQSELHRIHWKQNNGQWEHYFDRNLNEWGIFLQTLFLGQ